MVEFIWSISHAPALPSASALCAFTSAAITIAFSVATSLGRESAVRGMPMRKAQLRLRRATNAPDESIGRVVLPGGLRSPRALRCAPIDAFQQIAELRRRDRHRAVRRRWPDETAAL